MCLACLIERSSKLWTKNAHTKPQRPPRRLGELCEISIMYRVSRDYTIGPPDAIDARYILAYIARPLHKLSARSKHNGDHRRRFDPSQRSKRGARAVRSLHAG